MDRPGHLLEDKALAKFLGVEDVDFDSGSDTKVEGEEQSKPSTPVRGDIPHPAPNPFPERSAATALTALGAMSPMDTSIITNPLDEEQQRMLDQAASARRKSEVQTTLQRHSEYTFTPPGVEELIRQASRHTLATWATGPEAKTPTELECRKALRERYLEPTVMTLSQYRERLQKQAQGTPVPQIRGIPIIMSEDGDETAEDDMFIRWVHGVRRLSSMHALRESASVADVRLERKLRYDFAKLKARGRLREYYAPAMLRLPLQPRVHVNLLTRTRPLSLRRVRSVTLVKTSSAVALKKSTAYGQSCRRGTSYSHEFSDSGYPRHFTRYW
uniref:Uncharacterized protein n=1 Tax=Peronospora matthiolae TaxID=2874970 RepID=A0AAV1UAX4_9STRA